MNKLNITGTISSNPPLQMHSPISCSLSLF